MKISGKCSWFGGPNDTGVTPSEGLAFIFEIDDQPSLFLPQQPPNTTGLARRLDPSQFYIACRWDYSKTSKTDLLDLTVTVRAPKTGREFTAIPADWGPHSKTNRVADLSPGLMEALGIQTDDQVEVLIPTQDELEIDQMTIVISAGHGLKVRGAVGILDEVNEARKVTSQVAAYMRENGGKVYEYYENTATTQQQNLSNIVNYHNSKARDLDISVHFNAYQTTDKPMGAEVLYVSQNTLASEVSAAIAAAGELTDRGGKHRTNLYFLNNTKAPAILLEVCFVDSSADAALYEKNFNQICMAIAGAIVKQPAAA